MKKCMMGVFLAAALFLLTACGTEKAAPATEEATAAEAAFAPALDTQAELSLNIVGEYGNFEALEQVIQDFQQYYPNVDISYEQIADFTTGFPVRCAGGDSIDLFFISNINYDVVYHGAVTEYGVDLNTISGINLSAVNEKALAAGQVSGKQMLLPVFYQTYGLIANTTLLKKYDLSVPSTYEELEAACETLMAKGVIPLFGGHGLRSRIYVSDVLCRLMRAENSAELCAGLEQGILPESLLTNVVASCQSWMDKGYFNPEADTLKDTYNAAILRFFEGDIPFLVASSDTISGCKKREAKSEAFTANPFEYTYLIPSVTPDNEPAMLLTQMFFGVYNHSQNQAYANEFMRFMARGDELKTLAVVKGMPSTTEKTGDSRFTQTEALTADRKAYSVDCGISFQALSSLYGAFSNADPNDAAALAADFAPRMQ